MLVTGITDITTIDNAHQRSEAIQNYLIANYSATYKLVQRVSVFSGLECELQSVTMIC